MEWNFIRCSGPTILWQPAEELVANLSSGISVESIPSLAQTCQALARRNDCNLPSTLTIVSMILLSAHERLDGEPLDQLQAIKLDELSTYLASVLKVSAASGDDAVWRRFHAVWTEFRQPPNLN